MKIYSKSLIALILSGFPLIGQSQVLQPSAQPPILIELFTSQGCSSCPPAEELLNTWGMRLFEEGKALPLAFHVDYWDYLGWKDAFSSSFWTDRQKQYATFYHDKSLYTPEMVIDGRYGFAGSDLEQAKSEMSLAEKKQKVILFSLLSKFSGQNLELSIDFKSKNKLYELLISKIWVIVFENGLETSVERGENEGKKLKSNFVVRYFSEVPLTSQEDAIQKNIEW